MFRAPLSSYSCSSNSSFQLTGNICSLVIPTVVRRIRDCILFVGKVAVKLNLCHPEGVEDEAQQVVKARTRVKLSPPR